MRRQSKSQLPRFKIGDRVRLLGDKPGIVIEVRVSRYLYTHDKYIVRPIGGDSEFLVWDIELTKEA